MSALLRISSMHDDVNFLDMRLLNRMMEVSDKCRQDPTAKGINDWIIKMSGAINGKEYDSDVSESSRRGQRRRRSSSSDDHDTRRRRNSSRGSRY